MRIGIDGRLWNETGVGRYIRNLVGQLQKIDSHNEYVLFVQPGVRDQALGIRNKNWKVVACDIRWHTVAEQMKFPKILEKEKLDLVHFPYFSIPVRYNRPYVITIHDLIVNHFPTGKASTLPFPLYHLKHLGYQFVLNQAARNAQKILTVSEATKKEIVDHLPVSEGKVVVTYEGVDMGIVNREWGIENKFGNYFLYVGNAYPHKNLERLVEAFSRIKSQESGSKEYKLLLVGGKNYFYARLEEKVRELGLQNKIVFLGKVSDEELSGLYKNAKAVVLPSLMEGFGLPGLEAMHQGCLVLASDIPVFKEIYGDAAVYFDPLDGASIRATIQKVLDGKILPDPYISQGKKQLQHYSWEKMAKQTLQLYESSIGIRPSK